MFTAFIFCHGSSSSFLFDQLALVAIDLRVSALDLRALMAEKGGHGLSTATSSPKHAPLSRLTESAEMDFGETDYDVSDMKRLGKRQEFKVYILANTVKAFLDELTSAGPEKLWASIHIRVCVDLHGNLGICIGVCDAWAFCSLNC